MQTRLGRQKPRADRIWLRQGSALGQSERFECKGKVPSFEVSAVFCSYSAGKGCRKVSFLSKIDPKSSKVSQNCTQKTAKNAPDHKIFELDTTLFEQGTSQKEHFGKISIFDAKRGRPIWEFFIQNLLKKHDRNIMTKIDAEQVEKMMRKNFQNGANMGANINDKSMNKEMRNIIYEQSRS